jgi:hypothetical protein
LFGLQIPTIEKCVLNYLKKTGFVFLYGDKNTKWRPKINGAFGCITLGSGLKTFSVIYILPEYPRWRQNDAQKRKKKIFAAKWPNFNEFQNTFLCFVCPTSVHKT